jgi:dGTPase
MDELKKQMLKHEILLNSNATKSNESIRLEEIDYDIRSNFARDVDKIIHSKSYTRYMGKTQVYTIYDEDHISRRSTHVQFVSRTARTIARALGYNEDLCEAIALGHDLGHVPFGHVGERILNDISLKYLNCIFAHNVQSVRTLMNLENNGKGLNVSIQVLDGIMCHNGEFVENEYYPEKKDLNSFLKQYEDMYSNIDKTSKLRPMTIEGCIVRISDMIAYVGKDIEDAVILNNFDKKDIEKEISDIVGSNNSDIMNNLILDVINNSINKNYISMSSKIYNVLKKLKSFNYEKIYSKSINNEDLMLYTDMFNKLFLVYLNALNNNDLDNDINKVFLAGMSERIFT